MVSFPSYFKENSKHVLGSVQPLPGRQEIDTIAGNITNVYTSHGCNDLELFVHLDSLFCLRLITELKKFKAFVEKKKNIKNIRIISGFIVDRIIAHILAFSP